MKTSLMSLSTLPSVEFVSIFVHAKYYFLQVQLYAE